MYDLRYVQTRVTCASCYKQGHALLFMYSRAPRVKTDARMGFDYKLPRQGISPNCDQRFSCSPTSPKCCSQGCMDHNFHAHRSQAGCSAILVQKADSMLASIVQAFVSSRLPARSVPLTKGGQFRLPIRKTSKPSSRADGTRLAALHRSSNMPRCITSLRRDSAVQQRLCALMSGVKS